MKTKRKTCFVLLAVAVILGMICFFYLTSNQNSDIPQSLMDLLERNPETEDFVKNYPNRKSAKTDLSLYDRSQGVPLFLQWDKQWGYKNYGSDMIAITGCGPTCLAMAGYYLTGESRFSPDQVAAFAESKNYYSWKNGSKWKLISEGGPLLGLHVSELPLWKDSIIGELNQHHPVIIVVGPGDFTSTGHFLVLTGYQNGKFSLNDPNSIKNSERLWSYDELSPQIQNLWAISD